MLNSTLSMTLFLSNLIIPHINIVWITTTICLKDLHKRFKLLKGMLIGLANHSLYVEACSIEG